MAIIDEIKRELPKVTLPKGLQSAVRNFYRERIKSKEGFWFSSSFSIPYEMEKVDSKTLKIKTETIKGISGVIYYVPIPSTTIGYKDI